MAGKEAGASSTDQQQAVEKYPWLLKVFGVLAILGGIDVAAALIWGLYEFVKRDEIAVVVREYTTVALVIEAVALVLLFVLAVMYFVLGVRMLRGRRQKAALMCNIMIALTVVGGICEFMIVGLNVRIIPAFVSAVILVAIQSFCDPSLAEERQLQRKLRKMETRTQAEEGTLGRDTTGKGYIKLNFFNLFWIFVIACVVGVVIETIWHMAVVDPGHYQDRAGLLYGPFSPIYGFGAVLITMALNRFYRANPIIIFLVSALIGGAFEFFVSWFMQTAFGIVAWDYTGTFLSIDGRTNGMFMCIWGLLGLVWVKLILPILLKVVNMIPWNWRYAVTTVCAALMLANCVLTLAALDCWYQREANTMDYSNETAITQFCNEHYDNEFMANRFQSMTMNPDNASRVN